MIEAYKRKFRLDSKIVIRDGTFGFWLNLRPFLPEGCNSIVYYVLKEGKVCHKGIFLPHQIYLEKLMKDTENMKYEAFFEPYFPEYPSITLMKQENTEEKDE